jgi:hypothetical protein
MNGRGEQSAAAPSPFTPIADYAFISNCHTGALIAAAERLIRAEQVDEV